MQAWQDKYREKLISLEQAAKLVKSGETVAFPIQLHPKALGLELAKRAEELRDVKLIAIWSEDYPWFQPAYEKSFSIKELFAGKYTRQSVRDKRVDWVPYILGTTTDYDRQLFTSDRSRLYCSADYFFMKITPPNGDGICSFGHSLFYNPTAARTAKKVVAMVDPRLIWTHGDQIRVSEIDHLVEAPPEEPASVSEFIALPDPQEFEIADVIGAYCASLINDGDTIEIGTGTTSEQTWAHLHTKNDLGVDSEIIVPQTVELVRQGNITGKNRSESKGKVITSCLMAYGGPETDKALEFTNDNPTFEFHDISFQCNVPRIARQRSMVSINAAVAVDLLGQVVIDHIGPLPISGAGGQPEYLIGTHYSEGGRSITTLRSVTKGGTKSCIVPQLEQGSVVSIPAFYVDYLITENGIVNLENKTRRERAEAIISIANPEFQEELRKAAKTLFWP